MKRIPSLLNYKSILAMFVMVLMLASCSKDKTALGELLSTVPSSAGGVLGINVPSLVAKTGSKLNNGVIEPSQALKDVLADANGNADFQASLLFDPAAAVDPMGAVVFIDGYKSYLTFSLSDPEKFKNFVGNRYGEGFKEDSDKVYVCRNVAVKDGQGWVNLSQKTIDAKDIASYASLSESLSFLSKDVAEKISEITSDITGWGVIRSLAQFGLDIKNMSTLNLALGMLFKDAESMQFDANFLDGRLNFSTKVLDSKGKPAKYLLPDSKLDLATIKSVSPSGNMLVAINLSQELLEKISKLLPTGYAATAGSFLGMLQGVDGTFALEYGNVDSLTENLAGVVTTKDGASMGLKQIVSNFAAYREDGKYLRFSKGSVEGKIDFSKDVDLFKDATLGVMLSLPAFEYIPNQNLDVLALTLVPDGGGMKVALTLTSSLPKENILLTLMQAAKKK